jgi:hypothetical protein
VARHLHSTQQRRRKATAAQGSICQVQEVRGQSLLQGLVVLVVSGAARPFSAVSMCEAAAASGCLYAKCGREVKPLQLLAMLPAKECMGSREQVLARLAAIWQAAVALLTTCARRGVHLGAEGLHSRWNVSRSTHVRHSVRGSSIQGCEGICTRAADQPQDMHFSFHCIAKSHV